MKHEITNLIISSEVSEKIALQRFSTNPTRLNARKATIARNRLNHLYIKAYKQGILSYAELVCLSSNVGARTSSITRKVEREYGEYLLTLDAMAEDRADTEDGDGEF